MVMMSAFRRCRGISILSKHVFIFLPCLRTAMENVYTFFNPPVDAGKPAKDVKIEEQSRWNPTGPSGPQPLQSIPFLGVAGSEPSHFPSRKVQSDGGAGRTRGVC